MNMRIFPSGKSKKAAKEAIARLRELMDTILREELACRREANIITEEKREINQIVKDFNVAYEEIRRAEARYRQAHSRLVLGDHHYDDTLKSGGRIKASGHAAATMRGLAEQWEHFLDVYDKINRTVLRREYLRRSFRQFRRQLDEIELKLGKARLSASEKNTIQSQLRGLFKTRVKWQLSVATSTSLTAEDMDAADLALGYVQQEIKNLEPLEKNGKIIASKDTYKGVSKIIYRMRRELSRLKRHKAFEQVASNKLSIDIKEEEREIEALIAQIA